MPYPLKGYRNFRRLAQKLVKSFLERGRCPIHGLTAIVRRFAALKSPGAAIYHKTLGFAR